MSAPTQDSRVEIPPGAKKELRKEVAEHITGQPTRKLFGTFSGVFTPTLLTILGVIMYLREGWVVGNAGLLGAWLIILIAYIITTTTALSMASITTNMRIGAGGAFSIISQSLGLEVGGSIGIPLYLSQALAVAMYIFGFRSGWLWIFPEHSPLLIDLGAFVLLFVIAYISADLAFKVQYVIMAIILVSIAAVGATLFMDTPRYPIQWWGTFPGEAHSGFKGANFWVLFAVFFPAATGIMAGANMSGDLKVPRRSIPIGTLAAVGISFVIYMFLAWWLAVSASPEELLNNYTIMIDRSAWGPAVVAGLLAATFSSALSSLVGGPRILQALAEHRIIPLSRWLEQRSAWGEPRNAMLLTGVIVLTAMLLRDLNAIAQLVTMFFLITYGMINIVLLLEQSLRLVSFRPLLRIPRIVPLIGTLGCIAVMMIVSPIFGIIAVIMVIALHGYLIRKHLRAPFGDVRSGLFIALAEWAAKRVHTFTGPRDKSWKANLLVPIEDAGQIEKRYDLLRDIAYPKGFVRLLGLAEGKRESELHDTLPRAAERFVADGVFSTWTVVEAATFSENLAAGLEALGSAFFRSSAVVLDYPCNEQRIAGTQHIIRDAQRCQLGVLLLVGMDAEGLPQKGPVNVVFERPHVGWKISLDLGQADLALLIGYKLKRNWQTDLTLTAALDGTDDATQALDYLKAAAELARIPNARLMTTSTETTTAAAITLFSMTAESNLTTLREQAQATGMPCIFAMDGGNENALA
jgi:amino acid transporter